MNNEQNNMNNGIFNANPIPSNNPVPTEPIVPDTNLTPTNNSSPEVSPTASLTTDNGLPPLNSDNVIPVNNSSSIPEIKNDTITGLNSNLSVESSSPFDIGLNNQPMSSTQTLNTVISSINNENQNNNSAPPLTGNNTNQNLNNNISFEDTSVVSMGKWLGHALLFAIPVIGLILMIVKAISKTENKNISNYAKAQLLLSLIAIVLMVGISIILTFGYANYNKKIGDKTKDHINNNYDDYYDYD